MRKTGLLEAALLAAVEEMAAGLIDADLGGRVFKKRIALSGRGKRGGARTIVATNLGDRWHFVFGFAKNERSTISATELRALRMLAEDLLGLDAAGLAAACEAGEIMEIEDET